MKRLLSTDVVSAMEVYIYEMSHLWSWKLSEETVTEGSMRVAEKAKRVG